MKKTIIYPVFDSEESNCKAMKIPMIEDI